jgi:hypothetical protein
MTGTVAIRTATTSFIKDLAAKSRSIKLGNTEEAKKRAIEAGADPATVEVAEVEEIAMPYLPATH